MKKFNPFIIWNWYKKQNKIVKIILFVFIIAIICLAFFWCFFIKNSFNDDTIINTLKEDLIENSKDELARTKDKDEELEEDIEEELDKRKKNKKDRETNNEESKDIHGKIDNADSIDELADIPTYDDSRR